MRLLRLLAIATLLAACRRPIEVRGLYVHDSGAGYFFPCDRPSSLWRVADAALATRYRQAATEPHQPLYARLVGVELDSAGIYGPAGHGGKHLLVRRILELRALREGECPGLPRLVSPLLPTTATERGDQPSSPARARAMDELLEHLVGRWRMTGSVRGKPATYTLEAGRVLRHRFVELHMTDVQRPPAYEARVFIGADSAGGRYIAHWLDNFGAAYSIPHATGEARGDTLLLNFPYPDGPFRDTFVYDRRANTWYFRLESADSTGAWRLFAEYQVRRR